MTYPYPAPPQQPSQGANTVLIVLGVIGIVILLFCGGCLALVGVGLGADDAETTDRSASASAPPTSASTRSSGKGAPTKKPGLPPSSEEDNDTPTAVREGRAFVHDQFAVSAGWKVVEETYGGLTIEGLDVTNRGDDRRTALLVFRLYDGRRVLGEIDCSSNQMQSGETSAMDCFSFDLESVTTWDAIKVSDVF